MTGRRLLITLAVCLTGGPGLTAADWPQFRGPGTTGLASDKGLPVTWGPTENIAWKTELPGAGASSPIVVGDRVFLTGYSGYGLSKDEPGDPKNLKRHVVCLDRAGGKVLWSNEFAVDLPEPKYGSYIALHGYAASTPLCDGEHVYVFLGKLGVFAFNLKGKQIWQTGVGKKTHGWGSATSPILYKDLVIVNASVESGALVALNRKTGAEVWRAPDISASWSSPVLVPVPGGKTELVVSASKQILGFDPETGKELWHAKSFTWYVCPTVVPHDGVVYALQNSTCVAVKCGGRGDVTESHTLWQKNMGSTVSSAVYADGHLYFASGVAYCLNAKNGEVIYKERLKGLKGGIYASPILADGKIYYVSRESGTFVVEAGPKFKLLAHNTLDDSSIFNASPAVSNGQLLLRSDRYLYCIGKGK